MPNSYLEIRDGQRTAWYASEDIRNIATAAALLNRAIDIVADPDIATVEQCAAGDFHPITKEEFDVGAKEFVSALRKGLVAQIDLSNDQGFFTYWGMLQSTVYRVHSSISRLAGLYMMAYDKELQKLDGSAFVEGLVQHCSWEPISSPAENFAMPEQSTTQQGMTM